MPVSRRSLSCPPFRARASVLGARAAIVTVVLAAGVAAVACSDNTPVVPRAAINAIMTPGDNGAAKCQLVSGSWLVIGDNAHPINDGDNQNGAPVGVSCSVKPEGDGFRVLASAQLSAATLGGSITISGLFTATGEQQSIQVTFQKGDTGSFTQSDCIVTYPNAQFMGVAAGRVWGYIRCPKATYDAQNRVCEGTAEFKFENCQQ